MSEGVCIPCVPLSGSVLLLPTAQTFPLPMLCPFTATTAQQPLANDLAHKRPKGENGYTMMVQGILRSHFKQ